MVGVFGLPPGNLTLCLQLPLRQPTSHGADRNELVTSNGNCIGLGPGCITFGLINDSQMFSPKSLPDWPWNDASVMVNDVTHIHQLQSQEVLAAACFISPYYQNAF